MTDRVQRSMSHLAPERIAGQHGGMISRTRRVLIAGSLCLLQLGFGSGAAHAQSRNALWDVVHRLCLPDVALTGHAVPCSLVDRARGIAVVKDIGSTGYLLVPTQRVTGVEDPKLLTQGVPNYWLSAWSIRGFVEKRARRPLDRDAMGMAINAIAGRTQDQLHIHVDCVKPDVRDALRREGPGFGPGWASITLLGHPYRVRSLKEDELAAHDPFKLVADSASAQQTAMGEQTIALVGAVLSDGTPGFYLLAARANPGNRGHSEELLDHGCPVHAGEPTDAP
jgi:CDP-diacylglycerol pyrophosphatase